MFVKCPYSNCEGFECNIDLNDCDTCTIAHPEFKQIQKYNSKLKNFFRFISDVFVFILMIILLVLTTSFACTDF